jgi:3-oxoacyl-[acyl-carrier-protein] synthase II
VAVTGLGAVSALGWGVAPLLTALREGRTGLGPFARFDHSGHRTHVAGEVPDPPTELAARYRRWRRLTQADRFALAAADEALAQAGLTPLASHADPGRVGVFFGSSTGGMYEAERVFADLLARRDRGSSRAHVAILAAQPVSGPGDELARHLGVTGPVETISSACASATLALGAALYALRSGEVEVAVAGGSDSLCELTYAGFNALRAVAESPCRPFREGREGMSIGEGAAILILEPLDRALARGAVVLAELSGAGASCDAHHMTAPDPSGVGAAAAVAAALADAGMDPGEIDFLNAHGTGTPLNDAAEHRAFQQVFGGRTRELPLTATKAVVGHLLGSAGAIEAVATVLALAAGEVHPTPGEGAIDPELPVRLVEGAPLPLASRAAVSTNLAFGGSNAALVFSRSPAVEAAPAGRGS